ncbi:MAG TPA: aldo/keto reductase [archaeon]|nr:aldo/keto reductase [archaeon]
MEYREFAGTGIKVSEIGMGTYYGPSFIATAFLFRHQDRRDRKIAALKKGIDIGINFIDTAEIYNTESIVAEAIKDYRRDELFIATKVSPNHLKYDSLLKAAQRSLKRLRCSYIDLYQIHWPSRIVPIRDTMKAMEKLVEDGVVKYLGVSNFSLAQMVKAEEALSKNRIVSNQVEYSLKSRGVEKDLLPYCLQNNIAIIAYRPLANGALTTPDFKLRAVMEEISKKHGDSTPAQIALNWLLNKGKNVFVIPRASRPERVVENSGAAGWSLDVGEMSKMEEAAI